MCFLFDTYSNVGTILTLLNSPLPSKVSVPSSKNGTPISVKIFQSSGNSLRMTSSIMNPSENSLSPPSSSYCSMQCKNWTCRCVKNCP